MTEKINTAERIFTNREFATDTNTLIKALFSIGVNVMNIDVPLQSAQRRERYFFVTNNPGVYRRFDINKIIKDQKLAPNPKILAMEVVAGIVPFVKTIPIEVQKFIEQELSFECLPVGYKAKTQGVIMQEEYSKLRIPDAMGIGKPSLMYPRIQIDIYDPYNQFVECLVLKFLSPEEEHSLIKLIERIRKMTEGAKTVFFSQLEKLFNLLDTDRLADRLSTNSSSIGSMAKRCGFSILDCCHIILKYENYESWIQEVDPVSPALNLSDEQRQTLKLKKKFQEKGIKQETILPNQERTIERAIQIAQNCGATESIISGLKQLQKDIKAGLNHYYHNAVRFEPWETIVKGRVTPNLEKIAIILNSGELIPREGTFTKGEYLAGITFGKDSVNTLTPLMIEGDNHREVPIIVIFEVAEPPMPWFKHQSCSVKYVPVDLRRSQRRLIVRNEHTSKMRQLIKECGYDNVVVISYDQFLEELDLIEEARNTLIQETLEKIK